VWGTVLEAQRDGIARLSLGELLRKEDYLKSGDSGIAF
jgi:hypothetical protein